MTDLYVPDDLDPGEDTICDNCGTRTTWPTGYATAERCADCERRGEYGWKHFATTTERTRP